MKYINYEQLDNKIGRACHEEYALTYEQIKGYMETSDKVDVIESRWCEENNGEQVYCDWCGLTIDTEIKYSIAGGGFRGAPFPFNYCPNCGAKMKFIEVGRNGD